VPFLFIALGALLLFAAARGPQGGAVPRAVVGLPVSSRSRVALIGDSLAVGLGPQLAALAKVAQVPFQFEAHGGTTPLQWALHGSACGQCGSWLSSFAPTHVLVVLGTNDMNDAKPNASYYAKFRDSLQALGAHVVWVQPPNMPRSPLTAVRLVIDQLGVDVFQTENSSVQISSDGVHPTQTGYGTWAPALWSWLTGAVDIPEHEQAQAETRATQRRAQ